MHQQAVRVGELRPDGGAIAQVAHDAVDGVVALQVDVQEKAVGEPLVALWAVEVAVLAPHVVIPDVLLDGGQVVAAKDALGAVVAVCARVVVHHGDDAVVFGAL